MATQTLTDLITQTSKLLEKYDYSFFELKKKSGDYSEQIRLATENGLKLLKAEIADLDVEATIQKLRDESQSLQDDMTKTAESFDINALTKELEEKLNTMSLSLEEELKSIDVDGILETIKKDTDDAIAKIKASVYTVKMVDFQHTIPTRLKSKGSCEFTILGEDDSTYKIDTQSIFAISKAKNIKAGDKISITAPEVEAGSVMNYEISITETKADKTTDTKIIDIEVGFLELLGASSRVVEVSLKDITDVNKISQIEFRLSDTGIDFNDVDYFEIVATNLNFTNNSQMRMYALNSANNVLNGYMGYTEHCLYGSTSRTGSASHNSNNKYIWFPSTRTICQADNAYYGGGMNMKIKIPIKNIKRWSTTYEGIGVITYELSGWETSCSTYPQRMTGQWSNYSNNAGWKEDIHGFRLWGTNGNFADGTIKVLIHLKAQKVGA